MKVIVLLFVLLFPSGFTMAQSGNHNDGHSELHDYYKKLYIPDNPNAAPGSCCNERIIFPNGTTIGDCRPVKAWLDDNGIWHAIADGEEIIIPDSKIIRDNQPPAPDGNSHACISSSGILYCFTPGQAKI